MEPLMFIMAILGCGEGDAACSEVQRAETVYASQAECLEATEEQLIRFQELPYPAVVAQCRQAGERARPLSGSEVMLPDPEMSRLPARPRLADFRPRT